MVSRRRRPMKGTGTAGETETTVSERVIRVSPDADERIPTESANIAHANPADVVVLESEEEDSAGDESDGDSIQIIDPAPDDTGYNADAEDGDDNDDDAEDEEEDGNAGDHQITSNRIDLVDDPTDDENASPHEQGDKSGSDDAVAVGQSDPPRNSENGVIDGSDEERLAEAEESREETDNVQPITTATPNVVNGDERISDDESSSDELESREPSPDPNNNLQNVESDTDEGDDSVNDFHEDQVVTGITEHPQEEEELSDDQDEGLEDEDAVQIVGETANSTPRDVEESGDVQNVLVYEEPTSPRDNTEERGSDPEEASGDDDIAELGRTIDHQSEGQDEQESEVEAIEEANDIEPIAEADDNSYLDEPAEEQNSDLGENEEHADPNEAEVEKVEEQASESEADDDNVNEEDVDGDTREETGDDSVAIDDGDASIAENVIIDQSPTNGTDTSDETEKMEELVSDSEMDAEEERTREPGVTTDSGDGFDQEVGYDNVKKATERENDSSLDAENAEVQVLSSESDEDGFDEEEDGAESDDKAACGDEDEEGSGDMEYSDEDDVNTREYKVVPLMAPAATPDKPVDKGIESGSKGSEEEKTAKDKENESKRRKRKLGRVEAAIRKGDPKSGVIYLPRVPPGLDVTALRSLLSRVTQTKRIWLRPETKEQRRRRQSLGGSRRKERFRDGWVELHSSKEARRVVGLLNGRPMTAGKRKGRWAEDLWCLKYLKGFGWDDLTKEVFGGRERVLRVRESVMQGRRERAWIESRGKGGGERVRRFRQKRVLEDLDDVRAREAGERVDREAEERSTGRVDGELAEMLFKRRKT